jgi:AAA family ATP:ADP antiporter
MSDGIVVSSLKKWFGPFTKDELKRYVFLGIIFALIIGTYWVLRPLKDSIFGSIVVGENRSLLAWAKIVSLILLFPVVAIYSKLLHKFPRHHMIYFLMSVYAVLLLVWGIVFALPNIGLSNTVASSSRISGWLWYTFVESFGSIVVALFWAFVADISDAKSARYGFPLIVLIGQLGGILGPKYLIPLPRLLGFSSSAPLIVFLAVLVILVAVLIKIFLKVTPKEQLVGFSGSHTPKAEEEEPGFFEGLKLLLSRKYLLGIFAIISFFEIIATFIDFNFKNMVFETQHTELARSAFLGDWASTINFVTFLCILFGVNNIQRWLGVRVALALLPFIIACIMIAFNMFYDINVLYWLMISAKAINYALNGPTLKQLYVPTSNDVKYKAQAWIETFGSRGAKATSSGFNALNNALGTSMYLMLIFYASMGMLAVWLFIGLYLGKQYSAAVKENRVVC